MAVGLNDSASKPEDVRQESQSKFGNLSKEDIDYPRDVFHELLQGGSPYAFYLLQWIPYQTEAKRWRLKMRHDVKHFDGRIEYGVWPNGSHCGSFKDEEVEFIRISRDQLAYEYKDLRDAEVAE